MQVNSISRTSFGATIPMTEGHEKLRKLLGKDQYDKFCNDINEMLPEKTDIVTFKEVRTILNTDDMYVELDIHKSNKQYSKIKFITPVKRILSNTIMNIKQAIEGGFDSNWDPW